MPCAGAAAAKMGLNAVRCTLSCGIITLCVRICAYVCKRVCLQFLLAEGRVWCELEIKLKT
jgi:hypothetical protein